jgi:hypothetical protein
MSPTDRTIEILQGIRQGIDGTNQRVDALRDELTATRAELTATRAGLREELTATRNELSRRIVESEVRTSTAIADLAGTVREMTSVLRAASDLRPRVERCEADIAELKRPRRVK